MSSPFLNTLQNKPIIIEAQSWGSIAYFFILNNAHKIYIDQHENFVKASFRNRYKVCGPNGEQVLSIHLTKGRNQRKIAKNVHISHEHHWQSQHWHSLCSNYRSSPYFEYYEDDLEPIFKEKTDSLLEFNLKTIDFIKEQLGLSFELNLTESYIPTSDDNYEDLRTIIRPNKPLISDLQFIENQKYHQVFEDRNPFYSNLSILDALFNLGPRTIELLTIK